MQTIDIATKVVKFQPGLMREMVRIAYRSVPDPCGLMGKDEFTLRELQHLHEQVLGESVPKDSFRRQMAAQLEPTEEFTAGNVGKPARLYRKRSLTVVA